MRRTALLLALLLVPLAACGDDADTSTADDLEEPGTISPDDPVDDGDGNGSDGTDGTQPGDGGEPRTDLITPTPGLDGARPTAIDSAVLVGDDGTKVEVRFYNGVRACYGLDRIEVDETDTTVTVGVFTGSVPPGDQVCIDIAELQASVITLDAPLGDRELVDASTAAAVAVG